MVEEDFYKQRTLPGLAAESGQLGSVLEVPKAIGPYKIESLLERGGMSFVYLGTHPETKDPVIIKVLSPKYLSNADMVQRFLKEADIISIADNPNIVKLFGHGEWEGGLYIAMEFIQGVSLRHYLQHTHLSLKRSLEIILEIAYALCHLHTHGIIHRDLKLENILMTEDGHVKVIDFGIAQLLTEKKDKETQSRHQLMGTPIYMSPEQRENPESVSYPSDIYSLGIIAYELIMGKLSHGKIHLSLIPKGLQKILVKTLQPRPEDRYQDAVDFITDISAYLNSSSLEKEKKSGDQLSEMAEHMHQAQMALVSREIPKWPQMSVGQIYHKSAHLSGFYYDFVEIGLHNYGVAMAKPAAPGAEGIVYTAVFRGIFRALLASNPEPVQLAISLNNLITHDPLDQIFAFNYLLLKPEENVLHYISCGFGSLWYLSKTKGSSEKIVNDNSALGIDKGTTFKDIQINYNLGDTIVLTSFLFPENELQEVLKEHISFSPQKQAEAIFRKAKILSILDSEDFPQTVIVIRFD
jgi:serine phosphatase RsbU (regulator of sigma subunit)/tRNA A-37 threonylcarbamoyl transferase component Bud32